MQFTSMITALLLAHVLGDFVFQHQRVVDGKAEGRLRAYLEHVAVHAVLSVLALAVFTRSLGEWSTWILIAVILISHPLIDWLKARIKRQTGPSLALFLLDQMLHGLIIVIGVIWLAGGSITGLAEFFPLPNTIGLIILGYGVAVFATGWMNSLLLKPLADRYAAETNRDSVAGMRGLTRAGMAIGWLERALILTAVLLQSPVGVGFVLAAKSVFRFENTRAGQQAAEYFIIGTLVSVTEAVVVGLGLLWIIGTPAHP